MRSIVLIERAAAGTPAASGTTEGDVVSLGSTTGGLLMLNYTKGTETLFVVQLQAVGEDGTIYDIRNADKSVYLPFGSLSASFNGALPPLLIHAPLIRARVALTGDPDAATAFRLEFQRGQ